jgi:hypothetical protein
VYIDRHERHDWFDRHGDELAQLAAARLELHDRGAQDREERINDIRRDPPDWVTDRIGPRPDEPAAREHWDRAAAHLDDYREAFGHPPTSERPPRGDHRDRHAWEDVHRSAAKAIVLHPDQPTIQLPPQLDRDLGLDLGL